MLFLCSSLCSCPFVYAAFEDGLRSVNSPLIHVEGQHLSLEACMLSSTKHASSGLYKALRQAQQSSCFAGPSLETRVCSDSLADSTDS